MCLLYDFLGGAILVLLSFVVYRCITKYITYVSHYRLRKSLGFHAARTLSLWEWLFESEIKRVNDKRKHVYLEGAIERYRKFGNTFQTTSFGATLFNTIEPTNIKAILADNFGDYSLGTGRKQAFRPLIHDSIFNSDGPSWAQSRRWMRPAFADMRQTGLEIIGPHVDNLLNRTMTDGPEVDLKTLFFQLTLDTASDILFGKSCKLLTTTADDTQASLFADAFSGVQRSLLNHLCLGKWASLLPQARFRRRLRYLHSFIDDIIEEHRSGCKRTDQKASSSLLEQLDEQIHDLQTLRGQLMSLLLGGRDSTASLLSSLWYVIATRRDIQQKLRDEIQHLGQKVPTHADLQSIKYLKYCMHEALRLYPPVPINNREVSHDTVWPTGGGPGGKEPILVPAGSIVGWHCYAMHRRKDIFGADANDFRPERWVRLRPGWAFLPFNGGPRTCLGQQLALAETAFTTVRLLQTFHSIEAVDEGTWRECLTLTCPPLDGVRVRVKRNLVEST